MSQARLSQKSTSGELFCQAIGLIKMLYITICLKHKFWNPKHKLYYLNNLVIFKQKYVDVINITINH